MKLKEATSLKSTLEIEVESLKVAIRKLDNKFDFDTRGCVMVLKAMLSEREEMLSNLLKAIDDLDVEI